MSEPKPPILWLHGFFSHPQLLQPWVDRFEAAGYEGHVPTLPGRMPHDADELRSSGLLEFLDTVRQARAAIDRPPIVIGHSLGGLLAQHLAAETATAAMVLLASVPPGVLRMQRHALPYFVPRLPAILAGREVMVPGAAFRALPFSTLPPAEQDELVPQMVPDSGRVFRAMAFGIPSTRVRRGAVTCPVLCVSGTSDRNVSTRVHRRIARRYRADHQVHVGAPHWIVASSLIGTVPHPSWIGSRLPSMAARPATPTIDYLAGNRPPSPARSG